MKTTNNKNNKKYKTRKYTLGTQVVNSNIDPTTQYQVNRGKGNTTVADTEFNNSQQSMTNRGLQEQGLKDTTYQAKQNSQQDITNQLGNQATVQSAISKVNPAFGTAYGVLSKVGAGFNQKAISNEVQTGEVDKKNNMLSSLTTDTGSKLLGAKSGADVVNAFIPFLDTNKTTSAKNALAANEANKKQTQAVDQINRFGKIDDTVQAAQAEKGMKKIHIKPENKGKFTAYKKRTGKTTEEALHSSDPHVRKMANFAKNAAKWKHENGSKDLVLDDLIKSHSKSYSDIEEKESPKVEKQELKEFKKLKKYENKKYSKGTRIIETQGKEPIFTPKDKNGKRDLVYYNPNDPTHKEGGVKAAVVQSGKERIRGILNVPEGSAIVTSHNNENKKALKAYRKGDYKTLDKVINRMPEDKVNKKDDGTTSVKNTVNPADKWTNASINNISDDTFNRPVGVGQNAGLLSGQTNSLSTDSTSNNKSSFLSKLNTLGSNSIDSSPSIYNLGRGLLEKPQKTQRNYLSNQGYKYKNYSAPQVRAANEAALIQANNIRNATGGQGGAYLANQAEASANRFKNISDINVEQSNLRNNIRNANVDLRNQQNGTNLNLANQYNDLDLQNRARKNSFVSAGLTGLSDLSQNNQLMRNQANADRIRANTLETNNFKYNAEDEKNTFKKEKGSKKLKGNKSLRYKK